MADHTHAFRLCRSCKGKFGDKQTLQLAMLASTEPLRAACGEYVFVDVNKHRPCPSCQLRFGLNFKGDQCSMCGSTQGLEW